MTGKRFGTGLCVGKFAPLHRGHELLIETAREQCQSVIALSYSRPELPGCAPGRRRAWLKALFPDVRALVLGEADARASGLEMPHNDAPGEEQRRFVARVCHELLDVQLDAVFSSEAYGEPLAAALSQYDLERGRARERPVVHVPIDPERRRIPISGSLLRAAPYQHRAWLDPRVYASLIRRVALLGAESSGKTTLARALARAQHSLHVDELGRELWSERGGDLDRADLLSIARRQIEREESALPHCNGALFCDTSPLTTALYSHFMFGEIAPELEQLAQREYDLTVYCAPDFPFVQDGTRAGPEFQSRQAALTLVELARRGIAFIEATGPLEQRIQQVLHALHALNERAVD